METEERLCAHVRMPYILVAPCMSAPHTSVLCGRSHLACDHAPSLSHTPAVTFSRHHAKSVLPVSFCAAVPATAAAKSRFDNDDAESAGQAVDSWGPWIASVVEKTAQVSPAVVAAEQALDRERRRGGSTVLCAARLVEAAEQRYLSKCLMDAHSDLTEAYAMCKARLGAGHAAVAALRHAIQCLDTELRFGLLRYCCDDADGGGGAKEDGRDTALLVRVHADATRRKLRAAVLALNEAARASPEALEEEAAFSLISRGLGSATKPAAAAPKQGKPWGKDLKAAAAVAVQLLVLLAAPGAAKSTVVAQMCDALAATWPSAPAAAGTAVLVLMAAAMYKPALFDSVLGGATAAKCGGVGWLVRGACSPSRGGALASDGASAEKVAALERAVKSWRWRACPHSAYELAACLPQLPRVVQ